VPGNLHRNIIVILSHDFAHYSLHKILDSTLHASSQIIGHYHGTSTRHISSRSTCTHSRCFPHLQSSHCHHRAIPAHQHGVRGRRFPTADSYSTRACSITWLVRCSTRSCASCASELTGLHVVSAVSALCSCCGPTRCLYRLTPRPPNHQCPGRLDYVSCRVPSSPNT
jgi:hypothetical protein